MIPVFDQFYLGAVFVKDLQVDIAVSVFIFFKPYDLAVPIKLPGIGFAVECGVAFNPLFFLFVVKKNLGVRNPVFVLIPGLKS